MTLIGKLMCTISLKEMMINRTYPEAGAALYAAFCLYKDSVDKIVVDLDGVETLPSMFLNMSFFGLAPGQALQDPALIPNEKQPNPSVHFLQRLTQ